MQPVSNTPTQFNNEYTTSENFRLSEERERRFIDAYIKHLEAEGDTVIAHITPVGSKAPVDALLKIKENGRFKGVILEVKVRSEQYSFAGLPDTLLTQNKFGGMVKMLEKTPHATVLHLTFYKDGAVLHDLTSAVKQETELESRRVLVKKRNSDPNGAKEWVWKFVMPHAGHTPITAFSGQTFHSLY